MSMKILLESWDKYLNESSLSRTQQHLENYDCAILTAYRGDPTDGSKCIAGSRVESGTSNKFRMNQARNVDLLSTLKGLGYGVTGVLGTYIENYGKEDAIEVKEHSYFVVNLNEDPSFFTQIENLGQYFCQDAVLISPKGGKTAYLLGTNNNEFPSLGVKQTTGRFIGGETGEFMTRVGDRTYVFTTK